MSSMWASLAAWARFCPLLFATVIFMLSGGTAVAEPATLKSEFVDMMRWEHLNRTRPFYLSSMEWGSHCSLFDGAEWIAKCDDKKQDALDGEREATALLHRFGLENTVRKRGWIALHLPRDFKNQEAYDEFDVAWMEMLGKLIAGYRSAESDNCMHQYACTVFFNFDHETLALRGAVLLVHSETRSD